MWAGEGKVCWAGTVHKGEQPSDGYPAGWAAWMNVITVPAAKNMPSEVMGHWRPTKNPSCNLHIGNMGLPSELPGPGL